MLQHSLRPNIAVSVGHHQLELRAPDRATQSYEWQASVGVEERYGYELDIAETLSSGRGLRAGGWLGLGLGLGGAAAGVTLLALNNRDHGPTCSPALLDPSGACPNIYTTQVAGIATTAISGAALVSGIALLVVGHHRHRRHSETARVSPSWGGLAIHF